MIHVSWSSSNTESRVIWYQGEGDTVIVSAKEVKKPITVCFAGAMQALQTYSIKMACRFRFSGRMIGKCAYEKGVDEYQRIDSEITPYSTSLW